MATASAITRSVKAGPPGAARTSPTGLRISVVTTPRLARNSHFSHIRWVMTSVLSESKPASDSASVTAARRGSGPPSSGP